MSADTIRLIRDGELDYTYRNNSDITVMVDWA